MASYRINLPPRPAYKAVKAKIFDSQECDSELDYSVAECVAQDENVFYCAADKGE